MKKQLLLSTIAIVFALHLNAQSYIGGVISVDTTLLLANSPYIVTNNLLVQEGKKVVVEPGVIFKFQQGIYLQVDGEFQASSNVEDSIIFTRDDGSGATSWGGITFTDISMDYDEGNGSGCVIDGCILEYGGPLINLSGSAPKVCNSIFRNSGSGIGQDHACPPHKILNNRFYNLNAALTIQDGRWALVKDNEIFNCNGPVPLTLGRVIFTDNYIHDFPTSDLAIRIEDTMIVNNNVFENIPGAVLLIQGGDAHIVKCNTFRNDQTNIVITCERHPQLINNNFFDYQDWNVYWANDQYMNFGSFGCSNPDSSGAYATIDLGNNYWGGLTNTQMDASIWDFNDDFSLKALIAYTPTFPDSVNFSIADCSYPSVGMNEVSIHNDDVIEIYPNPFHDMSYIKIKGIVLNEKYKVVIFDSYGRMVRQIQVTNPERIEVSRDGMASGLYAYQLVSPEKKVYAGKFIVE